MYGCRGCSGSLYHCSHVYFPAHAASDSFFDDLIIMIITLWSYHITVMIIMTVYVFTFAETLVPRTLSATHEFWLRNETPPFWDIRGEKRKSFWPHPPTLLNRLCEFSCIVEICCIFLDTLDSFNSGCTWRDQLLIGSIKSSSNNFVNVLSSAAIGMKLRF